ncbi:MAG TPA: Smr/MutS family protein [Rhodocyclaceae bacterium]|jgi:DNA-nicking Smr family endonuclease|nr:Smr/MutS family protein [Rhodocyclaceae bacterium]
MKKQRPPTEIAPEERALFREEVADVVPLLNDRIEHDLPPPLAIPRQRELDEMLALAESMDAAPFEIVLEGGDELAFARNGIPKLVLRDLRAGRWVSQDQLDLHGMNREEARIAMAEFVATALMRGLRCVRIIHGKGLRSPGREPVLKELVRNWLANRKEVLAYAQTRAAEGGGGAVSVLLRRQSPHR